MKAFEEIETKLLALKDKKISEIEKYQSNIESAEHALKIANEKLETAEEKADFVAYDKAKGDIWTARHAIEMYQKKIDKIKNTPLLNSAERDEVQKEVLKIADINRAEQFQKAKELLDKIKSISDSSIELKNNTNDILKQIGARSYTKDMVRGLWEQVSNVPMFNIVMREGEKNDR
ncbi:hypothetical protein [Pseudolactococcus chungangensis]|uniref:hypothetical protein n=1 Tax=Pseudolactococcus chungangensis TaxID=451457 RepID=UPI0028D36C76|nr:hypothetical protein [Lactococcus chungangensis]